MTGLNPLDSLERQGYAVLRGVLAPAQLAHHRDLIDRIVAHAELGLDDPLARHYLPHRPDQGALLSASPGLLGLSPCRRPC